MRRVVITGMGAISTLGRTQADIMAALHAGKNKTRHMTEWEGIQGMRTLLGAPLTEYVEPGTFTRKQLRSMSSVSIMAVDATIDALRDAGLEDSPELTNGRTGVAYGTCIGGVRETKSCFTLIEHNSTRDINSSTYIRMMGHTAAVNLSLFFRTTGRLVNTSTACTSSSMAIGEAYELIAAGKQDIMIAGGAEKLHQLHASIFDTLFAASTRNDSPEITPSPFDTKSDGLVLGEGACTLIVEELEHALARGARIYAEIVGFATNTDGAHATSPQSATQTLAMQEALRTAGLTPDRIAYVSAHGTGTKNGDAAEIKATMDCFRRAVPLSTLKSYTGHTLGACGSLECMVCMMMMREGWFHPNLNLHQVSTGCEGPDFITGDGRMIDAEYVMSNNFAFGGINTSLILKRWES